MIRHLEFVIGKYHSAVQYVIRSWNKSNTLNICFKSGIYCWAVFIWVMGCPVSRLPRRLTRSHLLIYFPFNATTQFIIDNRACHAVGRDCLSLSIFPAQPSCFFPKWTHGLEFSTTPAWFIQYKHGKSTMNEFCDLFVVIQGRKKHVQTLFFVEVLNWVLHWKQQKEAVKTIWLHVVCAKVQYQVWR